MYFIIYFLMIIFCIQPLGGEQEAPVIGLFVIHLLAGVVFQSGTFHILLFPRSVPDVLISVFIFRPRYYVSKCAPDSGVEGSVSHSFLCTTDMTTRTISMTPRPQDPRGKLCCAWHQKGGHDAGNGHSKTAELKECGQLCRVLKQD